MVAQSKLKTARSLTQSADVSSISGLVTWLEATMEESFSDAEAEDASIITNWYDLNTQGATKNNAQQSSATANLHPTYKTLCINGLPCVRFNGSTNYIDTLQNLGSVTALSAFAVVSLNTLASDEYSILATNAGWTSGTDFTLKHLSSTFEYQLPNSVSINAGTGVIKRPFIVEIIDNGTNGTLYANKVAGTATATGASKNIGILNIGSYNSGSARSRYLDGDIGEIIIFNRALKNEERVSVENYLAKKWGVK